MVFEDIACTAAVFSIGAILVVGGMFAALRDVVRSSLYVRAPAPLGLTIGFHVF